MTDRGLTDSSSSPLLADQQSTLISRDQFQNQEYDCFHLKYQQWQSWVTVDPILTAVICSQDDVRLLSSQVVTVNPIELVFSPCDYIVPQIHGGPCCGVVEVAMSRRLAV